MPEKTVVLLSCPQMEQMAREVAEGFSHCKTRFVYSPISWEAFSDGFPNISLDVEAIRNNDVWFFASFDDPGDIFRQLAVIYALPRYCARSVKVVLPFFPTGTMERVDCEGSIATARTLARMFDAIPLTAQGPARIFIFDIHDPRERFYFSDQVIPVLESAIPDLLSNFGTSRWSVAFPDEGAHKRFGKTLSRFRQILCRKIRQGDKRSVSIEEGEVKDRDILVVDDLTRTGGTLIECAKALKEAGADTVNLVVPHAAFDNQEAVDKLIEAHNQEILFRLYTTDSCPEAIRPLVSLDFVFVNSLSVPLHAIISREEFH